MSSAIYLDESLVHQLREEETYQNEQYGRKIIPGESEDGHSLPTVYLLGCNDIRGNYIDKEKIDIPHTKRIREVFYQYFDWHPGLRVVDLGDVRTGLSPNDTKVAIEQVVDEYALSKTERRMVILFGGSGDQIAGAYNAYRKKGTPTDITVVNSTLPIIPNHPLESGSYLLNLLIEDGSHIEHYSHLAFQSYLSSLDLLTNLDKFSFENFRLGQVREAIDHQEPLFRAAGLVSFDLAALAPTAYPMFHQSPTGLNEEEACRLMQFGGMATKTNIIHIAGYDARKDIYNYYAMSVAQMIWYAIEGFAKFPTDETPHSQNEALFEKFDIPFLDYTVRFLKSLKSQRWWMVGANGKYIACDYKDYEEALNEKICHKWLRSIHR